MSLFPVKIPSMGESITQAVIGKLLKKAGEYVQEQEEICELETDKVNQVICSPVSGKIHWQVHEGDSVVIGQSIAQIDPKALPQEASWSKATPQIQPELKVPQRARSKAAAKELQPQALVPASVEEAVEKPAPAKKISRTKKAQTTLESIEAPLEKELVDSSLQESVQSVLERKTPLEEKDRAPQQETASTSPIQGGVDPVFEEKRGIEEKSQMPHGGGQERLKEQRRQLSPLRQTIASRLMHAQNSTATLTTFNEIDMSEVIKYREHYQEDFLARHGVKLGYMSFFTKAVFEALVKFPSMRSRIEGKEWVESLNYDIGIAVSTDRGLVVPVLRDCDRLSLAQIEKALADVALRAREGKIRLDELTGGCFTISNAGVFGSLLSTPILNPPQSAILGMHKIEKRAVVIEGDQIAVRPMMYVALSYDHRVIDGKDAVSFLVAIKKELEEPERLLLDI